MTLREIINALNAKVEEAAKDYDGQTGRIRYLEKCVEDLQNRNAALQGSNGILQQQLLQAASYAVAPPIVVRPPEGRAILLRRDGTIYTKEATFHQPFNSPLKWLPLDVESHSVSPRPFRKLYGKSDPSAWGRWIVLYQEDPA